MDWKRVGRLALTSLEWVGVVAIGLVLAALVGLWIMLRFVGRDPEPMGAAGLAVADEPVSRPLAATPPPPATPVEASSVFAPIHQVLVSPRCMNCHPDGDRPLARDGGVHPMNVSRTSAASGLACSTCHAEHNSVVPEGPPGAPNWGLPPAQTPMIFEGRSATALCEQLRDRERNGQRSLADLLEHVGHDPLVLWAWDPGGGREAPPIAHAEFVAAFEAWVEAGGVCPGEAEAPALGETDGDAGDESAGSEPG